MDFLKAMLQRSKLINSRDDWRNKAIQRANELREHRKADKRLRTQIIRLKHELKELQQAADTNKKNSIDRAAAYD
jgi:hypothetical protein